MGNNAAFTAFEATVIAVYNVGLLDQELLSKLMEPYRGVDIDQGGMVGTLTSDKLDVEEVVIKTFGVPLPVRPKLPEDYKTWTRAQDQLNEAYQEAKAKAFLSISNKFDWS